MGTGVKNNEKISIAGDININLSKLKADSDVSDFFDLITNSFLLPLISLPTRITSSTESLIDNIFTNVINTEAITGNIQVCISDNLPSFIIIPINISHHLPTKHNLSTRNVKNVNYEAFNHAFKPWITTGILISSKLKHSLFKKYLRCKKHHGKSVLHNRYKVLCSRTNVIIEDFKKSYFTNSFLDNKDNLKKV